MGKPLPKASWPQILTHVGALVPLVRLVWHYWQGLFFIDQVRQVTTSTGKTALVLLILSLACTPVRFILGFKQVLRVRRALGLYAFMYASLHLLTFLNSQFSILKFG